MKLTPTRGKFITVGTLSIGVLIVAASFIEAPTQKTDDKKIRFPHGYRKWTHVKTGVVGPQSPFFKFNGGFHHIYANEKAMEGYTTGVFPDGSIIVFDVIEAIHETDSNIKQGSRKHLDVMVRDAKKYADTGGWGYEEFRADNKEQGILTPATQNQCYTCHAMQKDFVFSDFSDASQ